MAIALLMVNGLPGSGNVNERTGGELERRVRIAGQSRTQLAADLKAQYEQGASIRELTRATGRSYGFIHDVLIEAQVPLRGRGRPWHRRIRPTVRLGAP